VTGLPARLHHALEQEPDVTYAVLFGSGARGTAHAGSDADIAIELRSGAPRDVRALGGLAARLEAAAGRRVDLVLLDEAPAALAYRIFRHGRLLVERDHGALVARKARALLAYLDWKPIEARCAEGVLRAAAARGR
jgi:predicted nucleotidyltransferase